MPSTTSRACSTISCGPSSERTPTVTASSSSPASTSSVEHAEGVEVGHVVARVQRDAHRRPLEQLPDGPVLADRHRRPDLEHLAPPVGPQPLRHRLGGDPLHQGASGVLVGCPAPVEGHDRALVLDPHAQRAQLRGVALARERLDLRQEAGEVRHHARLRAVRLEQLRAVEAGVLDPAHAHQPPHVGRRAARDAGHPGVATRQPPEQQRGLVRHLRVLRALDDRRERAVHVEEESRARGVGRDGV